jgi:predicted amidohydrolase
MSRLLCLLVTLLFTTHLMGQSSLSQETQSYVSQPQGSYVLQNLTLLDGTGNAARTNQDIIINGETIQAVGEDLAVPDGATAIDLQGKSAMPGMVMLHEHLFYPKTTPGRPYGIDQMTYSFPKLYLAGGVTSMRTAGSIMPAVDVNIKKPLIEAISLAQRWM